MTKTGAGLRAQDRAKLNPKVRFILPHRDASGAPTTVTIQGWTFALDFLGEVKCTLLCQGPQKPPPGVAQKARQVYWTELAKLVSPEWLEANLALYSPKSPPAPQASPQDRQAWAAEDRFDLEKEGG
jgi:hypothetical protein